MRREEKSEETKRRPPLERGEARALSEARARAGEGAALCQSFGELGGGHGKGAKASRCKEKEGSRKGGGRRRRRSRGYVTAKGEGAEAKEARADKESQRRSEEARRAKHERGAKERGDLSPLWP